MVIPLSAGEFRLLRAFVERPQRVLSREQLLDYAFDNDGDVFDRAVDVQVSRLRKKLERPGSIEIIRTVRGEGLSLRREADDLMAARVRSSRGLPIAAYLALLVVLALASAFVAVMAIVIWLPPRPPDVMRADMVAEHFRLGYDQMRARGRRWTIAACRGASAPHAPPTMQVRTCADQHAARSARCILRADQVRSAPHVEAATCSCSACATVQRTRRASSCVVRDTPETSRCAQRTNARCTAAPHGEIIDVIERADDRGPKRRRLSDRASETQRIRNARAGAPLPRRSAGSSAAHRRA